MVLAPRSMAWVDGLLGVSKQEITLEEERAWEEAMAEGSTALDLESWTTHLRSRRVDNLGHMASSDY